MGEKKRGGLDYTPRAFPGARDPDGPAPDLENQLAELGLVERAEPQESRSDARVGVHPGANPGAKKRSSLEYTPQAFPGARAPDGPAPGLEERLVQMGLAERAEPRDVRPGARHDTSFAPAPPPERRERPASAPPPPQREQVAAPVPPARTSPPAYSPPPEAPRERIAAPHPPSSPSIPIPEAPRHAERLAPPDPEPTRRTQRIAPPPAPAVLTQAHPATPQPVYIVSPPAVAAEQAVDSPLFARTAAPPLPPVPPEAAPRPLPVAPELITPPAGYHIDTAAQAAPRLARRAARDIAALKKLPNKEERCRLSVRLVASVDDKLNDLAHLRGLDRNTAVSVAIVQDWVECFGLQARRETR